MIKKIVYTSSTHDLNICHDKAMAHMNLMNLYQDKFQDIQEFRYQNKAMRKACDELGLRFGRCDNDALATIRKKGVNIPTVA